MQSTMEVRWFLRGEVPKALRQEFENHSIALSDEGDREDWYLSLPTHADLGIKLRQQKIEIKKRISDQGVQKLAKGVKGRIEQWIKWGFVTSSEQQDESNLLLPKGAWVVVKKARQQKQYQVVGKGAIEAVQSSAPVEQGCSFELVELAVQDQVWYSLGFEAFGREDRLAETLKLVVKQVFRDPNFPSMKAKHSFSYPKWLAMILSH